MKPVSGHPFLKKVIQCLTLAFLFSLDLRIFFFSFLFCISGLLGFPGGSDGKESTCNAGELGSLPRLGRSPGEGNGNPLQYSCLENLLDGGAWWATVHGGHKESDMTERLHSLSFLFGQHV